MEYQKEDLNQKIGHQKESKNNACDYHYTVDMGTVHQIIFNLISFLDSPLKVGQNSKCKTDEKKQRTYLR